MRASVLTASVLARPGTPSIERVAAAKEDEQELVHELGLADDDLCEFGADVSGEPLRIFHDQPRCSVN